MGIPFDSTLILLAKSFLFVIFYKKIITNQKNTATKSRISISSCVNVSAALFSATFSTLKR
jgi:hypothetical protein